MSGQELGTFRSENFVFLSSPALNFGVYNFCPLQLFFLSLSRSFPGFKGLRSWTIESNSKLGDIIRLQEKLYHNSEYLKYMRYNYKRETQIKYSEESIHRLFPCTGSIIYIYTKILVSRVEFFEV
jgi:hypothetical protein